MSRLNIGIDFGGTSIKVAVVSNERIIHEAPRINPKGHDSADALISILADKIKELKKEFPSIGAVGCGVPGFVDFPSGLIYNLTNVPGWQNIKLKTLLSEKTGLPCVIENDANCMAIAEWKLGAGKGFENLVCLTLGTGVGGGIIANNQMIRGAKYAAGELGQASIDYQGVVGTYNNLGAVEKYVGNNEIAAFVQQTYKNAGIYKSLGICFPLNLSSYAREGCPIALQCWDEIGKKLASSITNACWLLNPEAVIIGGGVANADDFIFNPIKFYINQQLSEPFKDHLQVLKAQFSNEAGMLGAAALANELY